MANQISRPLSDCSQLQQIVVGLPEGIIIVDPDGTIAWANEAALHMHGARTLKELGDTVTAYRARFELRYRDQQRLPPHEYPLDRLLAGEGFRELVVEVILPGEPGKRSIQRIRGLILADAEQRPASFALVIDDETERFDAEDRFERAFAANPAPAIIARLSDMRYVKVNLGFLELSGYVQEAPLRA